MDSLVVVVPAANLNETLKKYSLSSPFDTQMHGLLTYGQSECQFHVLGRFGYISAISGRFSHFSLMINCLLNVLGVQKRGQYWPQIMPVV